MLYVLQKEHIEHARLRALAQSIVQKEKGKEVFDEYMKVAFPWLETQKKRESSDVARLLNEEVKKGGMTVRPLWQATSRSRMKHKVIEREQQPVRGKTRAERDALYSRLGKVSS